MKPGLRSEIKELFEQLPRCMIADRFGIRRTLARGQRNAAQNKPCERDLGKARAAIDASVARAQSRRNALPPLAYPPQLPVSEKRREILDAISRHQVVIIAGETGSGKTTQIPKICLEAGRGVFGKIGHTQPRRLAARSVALRIAEELDSELGQCVGYKVRFNDRVGEDSYIKLMTDGILLAEIQRDRFLDQYDTLIIDEAHERSLNIDFLLGFIRQLLPKRPDLKLIITSATIDYQRFGAYFNDAPVIEVSGRAFPVEVLYRAIDDSEDGDTDGAAGRPDDEMSLENGILSAVDEIAALERGARATDILVFLSGEREIRQVAARLRQYGPRDTEILPLYSRLSNAEQNRVFQPHPGRRIVLATNVAETSITVPNIGYVIDSGLARISRYSYRTRVQRLPVEAVSRASADQRKGRCGRISDGLCIRLYSEQDYLARAQYTEPEILRTNLASVILQMESLRLGDIDDFPFIQAPDSRLIKDGFQLLEELGAIDTRRRLTAQGKALARLPVDPRIGAMVLAAGKHGALKELLVIASALSVQEPWQRPHTNRQAADQRHSAFVHEDSDFLTFVNLWQAVETQREALTQNKYRKWLQGNFLSYMRIREWHDVHRQLKLMAREMGLKENREAADYRSVHLSVLAGLLSHVGMKEDQKTYCGARNRKFVLFPGSALARKKPKWVMATEIVETHKLFGRINAKIEPEWIEQCGAYLLKKQYFEPHWEKKRACVMAYEKTSLFGLVINPGKKVHYGPVDPEESRSIFIHNALVAGDYATRADYHRHNKNLVHSLDYLENKSRRRDILVDEETIYNCFDKVVPPGIFNGKGFEKWRGEAERDNPELLFLREQDLRQSDSDEITRLSFPDELAVTGGKLKLDYQFEPGKARDGVTLEVPVTLLNQVDEVALEWLVPGLLREKCIALVKSLPKPLRKHFVPAPDFVDGFLAQAPDQGKPLKGELATYLLRRTGVRVVDTDWQERQLPEHLLASLRVLDEKGKLLEEGRDIRAIKQAQQAKFRDSLRGMPVAGLARDGITRWDFEELPEQYEFERDGVRVKTFPALVDRGQSVSIQLFEGKAQAAAAMEKGLLRLYMLALGQELRYIKKHCRVSRENSVKYLAFGSEKELANSIAAAAFYNTFLEKHELVWDREAFDKQLKAGKTGLVESANHVVDLVNRILEKRHAILAQVAGEVPPSRAGAYDDIRFQLDQLFQADWIAGASCEYLRHYPRYLKAVEIRISRLQGNIEKDRALTGELRALWEKYEGRRDKHQAQGIEDPLLDRFRWMLEEYRVSLFAQGLKTIYPVSLKRLDKLWQQITL